MKRLLLLFSLTFISSVSFSQTDFCVPGARWLYYSVGSNGPAYQNHVIYQGDTILGGYSDVHILKTERRYDWLWEISQDEFTHYVRQDNDSVYEMVDGQFELMYDYGVDEGDERIVHIGGGEFCSEQDTMVIDSIRPFNYQGESLQAYYFHLLVNDHLAVIGGGYYTGGGGGVYVERLGLMTDHPSHLPISCWPYNVVVEYMPAEFVCYTDNELAINNPDTCDLFLDAIEQEHQNSEVTIYQNRLLVKNTPNSTLHVYDILGKELLRQRVLSENERIDINHLPSGVLMVVLESGKSRVTKKVVKSSN